MATAEATAGARPQAEVPAHPDVFVSYARQDVDFVRSFTAALAERGKSVWVDWEDIPPTADWLDEVYSGIEAADAFIAIISPDSLRSEICSLELAHAVGHNKRIVPVLHRDPADLAVPAELRSPNWIFFRPEDDFSSATETLVSALEMDLDWVRAHTRLLVRALEWRAREGDRSFLLSGSELRDAERWLAQDDGSREPSPTTVQTQYVLASRRATTRRQRGVLGAVLLALAVTAVLAVVAVLQRNEAVTQARTAESRALAASAVAQLSADPELSVLLAAEAAEVAHTEEAEAALRLALPQSLIEFAAEAHDGPVNSVEFSLDGRFVLSAGDDGVVVVWDLETGKEAARLRVAPPPSSEFGPPSTGKRLTARFSPDGSAVLAATQNAATLWRWRTGEREEIGDGIGYQLARFTANDEVVVPITSEGRARLIDLEDGSEQSVPLGALGWIVGFENQFAAYDRDRSLLVLGELGGEVAVWDLSAGARLGLFETLGNSEASIVYDLALSGDGRHLAVAGLDGISRVWDWHRQREVIELGGHAGAVSTLVFDRSGDLLLSGSSDGTVRVWDWLERQTLATIRGHRGGVTTSAFSQDGRRVATGGADGSVRVWAVARERSLATLEATRGDLWSVDVSPDAQWILTAGVENAVRSGTRIARVWDRRSQETIAELRWPSAPVGDFSLWVQAAFSADASRVVAADGQGGTVWVWDWQRAPSSAELGAVATEVGRITGWMTDAAFSPDGSLVAASGSDGFVRVWRWRDGKLLAELASRGAERETMTAPALWLHSVAFSPDGDYLAAAGRAGHVWIWEWAQQRPAAELQPPGGATTAVFSPDGRWLATGGADDTVVVYDWRGSREIAELRNGVQVDEISFTPNGKLLVTGPVDGIVRVWDWQAERSVVEFPEHPSRVNDLAVAAEGRTIVTAADDGVARIFACSVCGSLAELRALVGERVTRELTAEERARYLP